MFWKRQEHKITSNVLKHLCKTKLLTPAKEFFLGLDKNTDTISSYYILPKRLLAPLPTSPEETGT